MSGRNVGFISLQPVLTKYRSFLKSGLGFEILILAQVADSVNS